MNKVDRVSKVIDLLWDKKVSTAKKKILADNISIHCMSTFDPDAFSQLTEDQKADVVITCIRQMLLNIVGSGGAKKAQHDVDKMLRETAKTASESFDPDK